MPPGMSAQGADVFVVPGGCETTEYRKLYNMLDCLGLAAPGETGTGKGACTAGSVTCGSALPAETSRRG